VKVAVIGGGSTCTPELVSGFLRRRAGAVLADMLDVLATNRQHLPRFATVAA
jgi:alpha-galactosidase/6-phospho-beta-glucosidase family protein